MTSRTRLEESRDEESDTKTHPPSPQRENIGGRPLGTTDENKRAAQLLRKKAVNWVAVSYFQAREGRNRAEHGTREKLVERAIVKFGIKGDFDVPRQTIHSRIKAERLEVWHTGTTSPLIMVEVTLNAYIIGAWMLNCPLSVSRCVELMNNLISGTRFERDLIEWKIQKRIYDSDPRLLG
jgi:hypothetical protein